MGVFKGDTRSLDYSSCGIIFSIPLERLWMGSYGGSFLG